MRTSLFSCLFLSKAEHIGFRVDRFFKGESLILIDASPHQRKSAKASRHGRPRRHLLLAETGSTHGAAGDFQHPISCLRGPFLEYVPRKAGLI